MGLDDPESRRPPSRVFISSPGDVGDLGVRDRARQVVERLSGREFGGQTKTLVPLLWENEVPASVGFRPQEAVDFYLGRAEDTDIYIGIFWRRIGSEVWIEDRHFESGTIYEFTHAYRASRRTGKPQMLLFRCTQEPDDNHPRSDDAQDQFKKVNAFFDRTLVVDGTPVRYQAFCQDFRDLDEFERKLETSLAAVLAKDSRPQSNRYDELLEGVQSFLSNFEELIGEERPSGPRLARTYQVLDESSADGKELYSTSTAPIELLQGEWDGRMLLLGGPGSGKTFEMLSIMWELLWKSRENRNLREFPVPVYFNLASWAHCYRVQGETIRFEKWAEGELIRRYALSGRTARRLVADRAITYCLDGLDELVVRSSNLATSQASEDEKHSSDIRDACVASINDMLQRQTSVKMVMCCQDQVYRQLNERPMLGHPLLLKPLSVDQVIGEMARWRALHALRESIEESAFLKAQCGSPLILRLMCVAYATSEDKSLADDRRDSLRSAARSRITADMRRVGLKPDSEPSASDESDQALRKWQYQLVDKYVERCRPVDWCDDADWTDNKDAITTEDIKRYLPWFASNLDPDFLVEDFQPSLLSERRYRKYRVSSVTVMTLVLAVCASVPSAIAIGIEWYLAEGSLGQSLFYGLAVFASTLLTVFVIGVPAFTSMNWLKCGLLLGAAFSIARGFVIALSNPAMYDRSTVQEGIHQTLLTFPFAAIVFCLFGRQTVLPLIRKRKQLSDANRFEILPLENINWTWFDRDTYFGGWIGCVVAPTIAIAFLVSGLGPARGFAFFIISFVIVTLLAGFSGSALRISMRPNQGIERSLRHATLISSGIVLTAVVASSLSYGAEYGFHQAVVNALLACGTFFTWLMFGGIPVIRHVCLGRELHRSEATPSWWCWPPWRRTVHFLDEMVRMNLLRKSAGGYMFRHGVLREYFRSLGADRDQSG